VNGDRLEQLVAPALEQILVMSFRNHAQPRFPNRAGDVAPHRDRNAFVAVHDGLVG